MTGLPERIVLGTRGSPLAMRQTEEVRDLLLAAHSGLAVEIREIVVTGDQVQDRPLSEIGGKGLFTKELDRAIMDGRCDAAVHSMKDVETWLADGIEIAAILKREDVRDVFLSPVAGSLNDLPQGAKVGTSSLRRKAQILNTRPDLEVVLFRGNVQTRLRKLEDGVAHATLLAMAGLNRLGNAHLATSVLAPEEFLPAEETGRRRGACDPAGYGGPEPAGKCSSRNIGFGARRVPAGCSAGRCWNYGRQ